MSAPASQPRALGAGDCEAWRDGPLGQPTNALTSAAYVAAGGWLLLRARRVPAGQRWRASGHGVLLAGCGIGSVAYHGRGGALSHWLHDVTLAALLVALPAEQASLGHERPLARTARRWALGTAPAAVHLAVDPETSTPSTAALVTVTTVGELRRWRRGAGRLHPSWRRTGRRRDVVAVAAVLGGLAAYVLGRTGAPTCRPRSRWQWHGVWHVLGAIAAAAWSDRVHVLPHLPPAIR